MDGVPNIYHTPYKVDLANKESLITPDITLRVPNIFKHPELQNITKPTVGAVSKIEYIKAE